MEDLVRLVARRRPRTAMAPAGGGLAGIVKE
jgi:hypothetical protein